MKVECAGIEPGQTIPLQYTCSGENMSPEISWKDAPENTKSFAIIVDDPDAPFGNWTHWVVYNIPPGKRSLPGNIDPVPRFEDGTMQGRNDFRNIGYGGPCPPKGHGAHRYFFRLYALDAALSLEPGMSKTELERAMRGHVLEHTQTMGLYKR